MFTVSYVGMVVTSCYMSYGVTFGNYWKLLRVATFRGPLLSEFYGRIILESLIREVVRVKTSLPFCDNR